MKIGKGTQVQAPNLPQGKARRSSRILSNPQTKSQPNPQPINKCQTKKKKKKYSKVKASLKAKGSAKIRNGRWFLSEHFRFIKALIVFGNDWIKIKEEVRTRSEIQLRSHSQKYLEKLIEKYSNLTSAQRSEISQTDQMLIYFDFLESTDTLVSISAKSRKMLDFLKRKDMMSMIELAILKSFKYDSIIGSVPHKFRHPQLNKIMCFITHKEMKGSDGTPMYIDKDVLNALEILGKTKELDIVPPKSVPKRVATEDQSISPEVLSLHQEFFAKIDDTLSPYLSNINSELRSLIDFDGLLNRISHNEQNLSNIMAQVLNVILLDDSISQDMIIKLQTFLFFISKLLDEAMTLFGSPEAFRLLITNGLSESELFHMIWIFIQNEFQIFESFFSFSFDSTSSVSTVQPN